MKIHLEYVAMLDAKGARSGSEVALPEGATISALLDRLQIAPSHRGAVTPFVNERRATLQTALRDGDRVFLAVPISGG